MAVANDWLFGPLLVRQIAATPAGAAGLHTTTAPTMLQGSPKENALPTSAVARINYRILPGDTSADVMRRAKAAVAQAAGGAVLGRRAGGALPGLLDPVGGYRAIAALAQRDVRRAGRARPGFRRAPTAGS